WPGPPCGHPPTWSPPWHLQAGDAPQPMRTVGTHDVPLAGQEDLHPSVAIPRILRGELAQIRQDRRVSYRELRLIRDRGPRHGEERARLAVRPTASDHIRDLLPTHTCAHHFFRCTSLRISISRRRSANSFFSR